MRGLPLWELCEGNLGEGFPCWGPWWIGRKGSGDRHLSPYGPHWELVRGLVYWGLREDERGSRDGASHSEEAEREGLEGGSLLYW